MPDKCSLYEESNGMCGGGLLALDGKSGQLLWRFWTRKDVLFIECSQNVNEDSTNDCLVSGKGGVLCVLDGKTGSLIWRFDKSTIEHRIDLYSAQYIFDLNDDGSAEVLISHTSDKSSHLVILNGRNGKEIGQIESPDKKSIFTVPRVLHTRNNTYNVVFSTGSLESPGTLYSIPLESIALSDVGKCVKIWSAPTGVGSGILLVDVNNDQSLDIVFTSGHTVTALSGSDNSQLWNVTSVEANPAQILVGPTPAYFDDDPIPDLLVTEMIGPSFPTYYYSKTWVASGSLGKSLLNYDIIRSGSVNAPGISLSFSGTGNDMFLYWITTCSVPDSLQQQPFYFSQDTTLHEKTHAELCKLRFNKTEESRLYILSQHIEPPGILIYSSKNQWDIEHNNSDNTFSYPKSDERNKYNSNFRHKGQPFYQIPSEPSQKKSSYGNYPQYGDRETQRSRWQSPQVSYDDRLPLLSNMNLGDLADAYYSQEGGSPDLGGTVDDGRDERANYRKEMKREAPAQSAFLPRATSTATLVNGVNGTGVEVVFATFWEAAATNVRIFNENQQKCIQQKLAIERSSNNLNSLELEMVEESAERECIGGRSEDWGAETDSPPTGQLTVFRLRLEPSCSELRAGEECSRLLPFTEQSYPRRGSDVVFKARPQPLHQFLTA